MNLVKPKIGQNKELGVLVNGMDKTQDLFTRLATTGFEQLIEHDIDRGGAGIAFCRQVGKPFFFSNDKADSIKRLAKGFKKVHR